MQENNLILRAEEIEKLRLSEKSLHTARSLFEIHGYLKIENVFTREFVQTLAEELFAQIDGNSISEEGAQIHRNRYIVPVRLRGSFSNPAFYANPILLSLFRSLLGPDCILHSLGAVISLPGATEQHIHSDYGPLFEEEPFLRGALPPYALTVAIPLVDIDWLNGPTKIWSGSHRTALGKESLDQYPRHLVCGPMGSCYFWDYRTLHAGGSNHSDQMRPLLYMAVTRRWFKDYLNPEQLIIEGEIPDEHRDLFPIPRKRLDDHRFQDQVKTLLKSSF